MIYYETSKSERNKSLAIVATIGTLVAPHIFNLYCKGREEELLCLNNVDDPPPQIQTTSETDSTWGVIDYSITTASGNASAYPSP